MAATTDSRPLWLDEELSDDHRWSCRISSVLFSGRSEYQEIDLVDTPTWGKVLLLDGKMQSTEADEQVYHELLVHPAMLHHPNPRTVFIMGGGEGATAREVLRHAGVEGVVMVDIDKAVCDACAAHLPRNAAAFASPRLTLIHGDARIVLAEWAGTFDVIIGDLCDPLEGGPAAHCYTQEFYADVVAAKLNPGGIFVTQSGPAGFLSCQEVFTVIHRTLATVFPHVLPYAQHLPSFCDTWGFNLAIAGTINNGTCLMPQSTDQLLDASAPVRQSCLGTSTHSSSSGNGVVSNNGNSNSSSSSSSECSLVQMNSTLDCDGGKRSSSGSRLCSRSNSGVDLHKTAHGSSNSTSSNGSSNGDEVFESTTGFCDACGTDSCGALPSFSTKHRQLCNSCSSSSLSALVQANHIRRLGTHTQSRTELHAILHTEVQLQPDLLSVATPAHFKKLQSACTLQSEQQQQQQQQRQSASQMQQTVQRLPPSPLILPREMDKRALDRLPGQELTFLDGATFEGCCRLNKMVRKALQEEQQALTASSVRYIHGSGIAGAVAAAGKASAWR